MCVRVAVECFAMRTPSSSSFPEAPLPYGPLTVYLLTGQAGDRVCHDTARLPALSICESVLIFSLIRGDHRQDVYEGRKTSPKCV